MARTKKKDTPGQKLWLSLYRADCYDREAINIAVPTSSTPTPQGATRSWLEGMSRHLKTTFAPGLRTQRETLNLTQQEIADIADLTVTAVAMIERGERSPNLETAARLCWALDVAAGVSPEDLV